MTSQLLRGGHPQRPLLSEPSPARQSRSASFLVSAKVANATQKLKPQKGTQRMQPKKLSPKQSSKASFGTIVKRKAKQATEIAQGKGATFKPRSPSTSAPLLLARVQQLRLLSKLEQAGLLTLLERSGVTLTFIEKSGLLSKAESLGLLSAAADRNTPTALYRIALALYAAGPLLVYAVPDSSTPLVIAQAVLALGCLTGGTTAFGAASLLGTLQKDLVS